MRGRSPVHGWLVVCAALAPACSGGEAAPPPRAPLQPEGWDEALALDEATDLDADPRVVEVALEARTSTVDLGRGAPTRGLWTYGPRVPGPLIRARVGDRVVVHLTNHLPHPTTIHWHGVRLPNAMDGVPEVSQPEVQPGERFTYDFIVPDAGLYWYHPHVLSAAAVGYGLYGPLLVSDPSDPVDAALPADELVMVLSDLDVGPDDRPAPPDSGGELGTLFGREGNTILVNGRVRPVLGARSGRPQRWRLVNAARSRYFQLEVAGHRFLELGTDGGRRAAPVETDRLLLIPGERADVLFTPSGPPGDTLRVRWIPYDRGFGSVEYREPEDVFYLALDPRPAVAPASLPSLARALAPIELGAARPVALRLEQVGSDSPLILGINGQPAWAAAPIAVRLGETLRFDVTNTMEWSHPFHLHGFFFQVLDASGAPRAPVAWKDTVDVPKHGAVSLAARFDERPGMWMFHCHVLDHADAGMMGMLHLSAH